MEDNIKMEFKTYDILSSLIPGFIVFIGLLNFSNVKFDKDLIILYTALAFLLGYIVNTLSSWLEEFYFWTWGGKPSSNLLKGENIWKVKFYHYDEVKLLLVAELNRTNPKEDELFSVAMRYANQKDSRTDDFNAEYAFSRSMLTTVLLAFALYMKQYHCDWKFYVVSISLIVICWLRCKQRGYYFAREVLTSYQKIKSAQSSVHA